MEQNIKHLSTKYLSEIFTTYPSQCENTGSKEKKDSPPFFLTKDFYAHNAENSKGFELLTCEFFFFLFLEPT